MAGDETASQGLPSEVQSSPTLLLGHLERTLADAVAQVERLLTDTLGKLRAAAAFVKQPIHSPAKAPEPEFFLDFSLNQLKYKGKHLPLPRNLAIRTLEQLCRGRMSVLEFLLLHRSKASVAHKDQRHVANALNKELAVLRHMIDQHHLRIQIERDGNWIRAHFDADRLETNVTKAKSLAKKGVECLRDSDWAGAVVVADQALREDFDCTLAALVVVRVLEKNDKQLHPTVVSRAQVCLARSLVRSAASIARLPERSADVELAAARRMAEQVVRQLEPLWHALLSWPFDESPNRGEEHALCPVRDFVEMWVKAFRGDALRDSRFATNSIVIELVNQMLQRRLKGGDVERRNRAAEDLTHEVFEKLRMNGWLPTATASKRELREQLNAFLARKIDWKPVLGQRGSGSSPEVPTDSHQTPQYEPTCSIDENIDVTNILESVKDERKRLAFQLFKDGLPFESENEHSIARALKIDGATARAWVNEVREQLSSIPAVQEMLRRRGRRRR